MKPTLITLLALLGLHFPAFAQEEDADIFSTPEPSVEATPSASGPRFSLEASTTVPLWAGPRANLVFFEQLQFYFGYGFIPKAYAEMIGHVAADMSNNQANQDVIEAAFDSNNSWLLGVDFKLKKDGGWMIGGAYQKVKSEGTTDLLTVGEATGTDVTTVNDLLTFFGLSNKLTLKSDLDVAWLYFGYTWATSDNFFLTLTGGAAKVVRSREELTTGISEFDNSEIGDTLKGLAESELESLIQRDAITPIIGLTARYTF